MRRQLSFLTSIAVLAIVCGPAAQGGSWNGYMNVFDKLPDGSQGGYLWGSGWGVNDLKTTLIASPGTGTNITNNA
ncbi:MAG: hypothetical protein RLZZ440_1606, partial [Planctomycetota bacterium]